MGEQSAGSSPQRAETHRRLVCLSSERLPEHVHAPPGHGCEEPRPQVSRRVDGVAAVETHGHGDGHDHQADAQRLHTFWGADVLPVSDGQDAQDERTGSNNLGNQPGRTVGISSNYSPQQCCAVDSSAFRLPPSLWVYSVERFIYINNVSWKH